ncbi:MAG: uL15 family ribosomal protein [Candidatus Aenigmarchaeota archaeon]|nr:uL15 family ribosomal protein [Candidatus Aenigmarchaeota archaeon]
MTARFKQKRKGRGSGTGYGSKKKHRGKGSRGGKGFAGLHKHKWSWVVSKAPQHYGYKGFVSRRKKEKAINVGDVEKLITDNRNEIDLKTLGYGKLLSRGNVQSALTVKVAKFTERAKEKIEKAGGRIEVVE